MRLKRGQIKKPFVLAAVAGINFARRDPGKFVLPGAPYITSGEMDLGNIRVYNPEDRYGRIDLHYRSMVDYMSLSSERIQSIYDRIGPRYDWFDFYESAAREAAIGGLGLEPGQRVLNAGVGTGKVQSRLKELISPSGLLVGLDLSPVMARLAYQRMPGFVVMADVRNPPMASRSYDRIFAAYVFDLLPQVDLHATAAEFRRLLRQDGRVALVSLTEGVDRWSRGLVQAWKWVYGRAPALCGGCRPLLLSPFLEAGGLQILSRRVVVEWGVPSEVIIAQKRHKP